VRLCLVVLAVVVALGRPDVSTVALATVEGLQLRTPPRPAGVQFDNVSAAAGIDFTHISGASPARHLYEIMSGGGLFLDYDNDGWQDILLVDGGSLIDPALARRARHRLFHNRGDGTFDDVTAASGLTHPGYGMGGCAADYDNDGFTDVYITNVGSNALFHNNAGKTFSDVTRAAGVGGAATFSSSCAWADVDRDGDVDLFVVNYVDARVDNQVFCGDASKEFRVYCHPLNFASLRPVLYRNNGNGTFTDISREAGVFDHRGNGLGIVIGDYDDDGWPDAFVANDTTPNLLLHNEQGKRFTEVALPAGVSVASDGMPRAGMGTDFGDFDGDGRLDVFVTNHEFEGHTLFRNLGGGLFEDVTFTTGVGPATLPFVGFGTLFFDADNDGDLDLAIANGHVMNSPQHVRPGAKEAQRRLLLRNEGGRFRAWDQRAGRPPDRHHQQPERNRGAASRHGRHDAAAARGEGGIELPRAARSARALRPGRRHADRPARDPLAERQGAGSDHAHPVRPDHHDYRRQADHRTHAVQTMKRAGGVTRRPFDLPALPAPPASPASTAEPAF
jgi:hypothetical protein